MMMAAMEERALPIVFVGHVDHGKSTLIGRLFYDTGCLPPDKVEEIRKRSSELGKEMEWAFIMDHLEEERRKGITIDVAHTFFRTARRRYVIIDAPGHKEFLKNMMTGSSQAEAALLLIDISEGIREQTRRHCYLLGFMGIRQVAVVVNKMDTCGYSRERYEAFEKEVRAFLSRYRVEPTDIVPISARTGENVAKRGGIMTWHGGPTLLEALDRIRSDGSADRRLRFPVQDVYRRNGRNVAVGRVETGSLSRGQEVTVLPDATRCRVSEILKFGEKDIDVSRAGECIGLVVEGAELERSQVLTDNARALVGDTFDAHIFWLDNEPYSVGAPLTWKLATQSAACRIDRVYRRFDPATLKEVETDSGAIANSEIAVVRLRFERPVVLDRFSDIPEMGRFVLEVKGYPVAGGIVS
jgi:sulfate adenylyltransferase subunit 1